MILLCFYVIYVKCSTFTCNTIYWHWSIATFTQVKHFIQYFFHPCPPLSPVTVVPAAPIPHHSTLRLIASVNPDSAISKITWVSPDGVSMKSERKPNTGTVAKLPQVFNNDNGTYVCMVRSWGNGNNTLFPFDVDVTVDGEADLRERKVKALRNRIHLLRLLMFWVGISARNSSSNIIYLRIL